MIRCTENYLIVKIEKRFRQEDGSIKVDPTWFPEEYVTQQGVVCSVPLRYGEDKDRPVVGNVKVGDKVWFSYSVLFEYDKQESDESFTYTNLVLIDGQEYWKVHIGEVFLKEGKEIEMVTDNVLLEPVESEMPDKNEAGLLLQKQKNDLFWAKVVSLPKGVQLSCNVRDVVCIEPVYIQKYNILGGFYYIVRSRRLLAKR